MNDKIASDSNLVKIYFAPAIQTYTSIVTAYVANKITQSENQ